MPFEEFNVGDRVSVSGPNEPSLFVAEVLQGQWSGYFHLRYSPDGNIIERDGKKKRYHRSLLTKMPPLEGPRSGT